MVRIVIPLVQVLDVVGVFPLVQSKDGQTLCGLSLHQRVDLVGCGGYQESCIGGIGAEPGPGRPEVGLGFGVEGGLEAGERAPLCIDCEGEWALRTARALRSCESPPVHQVVIVPTSMLLDTRTGRIVLEELEQGEARLSRVSLHTGVEVVYVALVVFVVVQIDLLGR